MYRPTIVAAMLWAVAAAPHAAPLAEIGLLDGWSDGDGRRIAGLSIIVAPGWKTYWRSPGEGGLPPDLDWSASRNLADLSVEWPAPMAFDSFGMTVLGYEGHVVLPLVIVPRDPAMPVVLDLAATIGVCAEICVPVEAQASLVIEPGTVGQGASLIRAHRARVPVSADVGGVVKAACGVRGAGSDRVFEAQLRFDHPVQVVPRMVVEGPPAAWFGPVSVSAQGTVLTARSDVAVYGDGTWIGRDSLRMTLLWPAYAVDVTGCAALATP